MDLCWSWTCACRALLIQDKNRSLAGHCGFPWISAHQQAKANCTSREKTPCWGIRQQQAWKGLQPQGQQGQVHLGNTLRTASLTLSLPTHDFKFNKIRKLSMQDTKRRICQPAEESRTAQVKQAINDSFCIAQHHFTAGDSLAAAALARTHISVVLPRVRQFEVWDLPKLSSCGTSAICHNLALALNHWLELQSLLKQFPPCSHPFFVKAMPCSCSSNSVLSQCLSLVVRMLCCYRHHSN